MPKFSLGKEIKRDCSGVENSIYFRWFSLGGNPFGSHALLCATNTRTENHVVFTWCRSQIYAGNCVAYSWNNSGLAPYHVRQHVIRYIHNQQLNNNISVANFMCMNL